MVLATKTRETKGSAKAELVEEAMTFSPCHQPVLFKETIQALAVRIGGRYIDCTVGEGGHAEGILDACLPDGSLLGIDRDPSALVRARQRLQSRWPFFTLVHSSYANLEAIAVSQGFGQVDGILFDLGLSSFQLEGAGRGFSFQRDEPLDMRFDPTAGQTAADIVNTYPLGELALLLQRYGEERRAWAIARALVQHRPLATTGELAGVVMQAAGGRRGKIHPATRTFQALRIAVNGELDHLEAALAQAIRALKPGGRLVAISYHSLEDRIVKTTFARESRGCLCPPSIPICVCGHVASLKIVSRKGITPSHQEIERNPRSRSARLRATERLP